MKLLMCGADPEVFVKDVETGEIESSIGVVEGDKDTPFDTGAGLIHRDNVLAEMNVIPAASARAFSANTKAIVRQLEKMLTPHGKTISIQSSHVMEPKWLNHFEAMRFGCNPNENCWDLSKPNHPDVDDAGALRTAAGHIHMSFDFKSAQEQIQVARACEVHIGLRSIAHDSDSLRRTLYGKSGSFRPKPYGIEYTVPSNFWLHNTYLMEEVFTAAARAVANSSSWFFTQKEIADIQQAINLCDVELAKKLCDKYGLPFGFGNYDDGGEY